MSTEAQLDLVEVPKGDLRVGDFIHGIGSDVHRVTGFEPYTGSNLAHFGEGTRVVVCADGFAMTLTAPRYRILRRPEAAGEITYEDAPF